MMSDDHDHELEADDDHCRDLFREGDGALDVVLTSYPAPETRHPLGKWMTCAKCGDKRQMKNKGVNVYECQGCGQRWRYPPADVGMPTG